MIHLIKHTFKYFFITGIFCIPITCLFGQYSPAAEKPGSDAIIKSDSRFKEWASGCSVKRGYIQSSDTTITYTQNTQTSNHAFYGSTDYVIGTPKGGMSVLSLGDGGSAVVTFEKPISDGDGPDFAVFENALPMPSPPYLYFLELAFVEVSTDGERYVRFPSVSLTQTDSQIESFGQLDPTQIFNLAGKYTADYGTPFDLHELKDSAAIDINNIKYVRLVDVTGSIDPKYGTHDSQGHMINDPFPTPFWNGGFDLQAVGVLNLSDAGTSVPDALSKKHILYPNPVRSGEPFFIADEFQENEILHIQILNTSGNIVAHKTIRGNQHEVTTELPVGIYIIAVSSSDKFYCDRLVVIK